jgi:hypothetical protein
VDFLWQHCGTMRVSFHAKRSWLAFSMLALFLRFGMFYRKTNRTTTSAVDDENSLRNIGAHTSSFLLLPPMAVLHTDQNKVLPTLSIEIGRSLIIISFSVITFLKRLPARQAFVGSARQCRARALCCGAAILYQWLVCWLEQHRTTTGQQRR